MGKPTELLKEEHEIIKGGLDVLESFSKLELNRISTSDIKEILEFLSEFADKCHHAKEEDSLYPLGEKRGIPKDGGPIGVMLAEHDEGRKLRKSMLEASKDLDKDFERFRESARSLVALLRQHIDKEDNILYPMIDSVLNNKDKEEVLEEFERIEEGIGKGVHEKYHESIKRLTEKYGV